MTGQAAQPIVRFATQVRTHSDCTIAALAMCLGMTYPEALVLVAAIQPKVLKTGATWRDLQRAARRAGARFRLLRGPNVEDEDLSGVLSVEFPDAKEHAVYLRGGLIFDGRTEAVWEADVYLRAHGAVATSVLVRVA